MHAKMIREKLCDDTRFADDKKAKAIYTMVEDEISLKSNHWDDEAFVAELDRSVSEYERGEIKAPT